MFAADQQRLFIMFNAGGGWRFAVPKNTCAEIHQVLPSLNACLASNMNWSLLSANLYRSLRTELDMLGWLTWKTLPISA